jgi:hypothetical protein
MQRVVPIKVSRAKLMLRVDLTVRFNFHLEPTSHQMTGYLNADLLCPDLLEAKPRPYVAIICFVGWTTLY